MLETLVNDNDRQNSPYSNDNLRRAVSKFMAETEEEERNAKDNAKNVTIDTLCQSPLTINTQRKNSNVANESRISSDNMEETIKVFKGLKLQSTVNDYAYYNSDKGIAESDPKEIHW